MELLKWCFEVVLEMELEGVDADVYVETVVNYWLELELNLVEFRKLESPGDRLVEAKSDYCLCVKDY